MKKITLALVTALALASQVTPAQAAQKTPYCPSKDKVNAEIVNLYKSNKGVKKDRKKLIYLNEKTYNALKAKKQWKKLKAMQAVRYSVELSYGEDAAKKLKLDCSFKENKKVSKKNKARYQITLTVSDDAAYKAYKTQQQQPTQEPTTTTTPQPSTPTQDPTPPLQQPTQQPEPEPTSTPVHKKTPLEWSYGIEDAKKIVAEVRERINDYERWFSCTANDFEKASIIAGWVDEHMDYCAQGDMPEDCGDILKGNALGDCTCFATLNQDIAEYFDIDVTPCQKPGHIWNILTVDGVKYEYDATDAGRLGMYFKEISHGRYAKYNVREFGGSVATINDTNFTGGIEYYAQQYYSGDYGRRDICVKDLYYVCDRVFWVTDMSKEKGYYGNGDRKYYYKDFDRVTQVLEKISDNEIQRYYEEWSNTTD